MISADLVARAVIAAALVARADPVAAMTATHESLRRPAVAAADGLVQVGVPMGAAARMLGLDPSAVFNARWLKDETYPVCVRAAARAVEFAGWRPEARESIAAAVEIEVWPVAAEPMADALPALDDLLDLAAVPATADLVVEPVAVPHPEIAAPARRRAGGAISSAIRPSLAPAAKVTPTSALRDRILDLLKDGSATAKGLASRLDAKELYVSQALTSLAYEDLVDANDPPAPAGRSEMRWFLRAAA